MLFSLQGFSTGRRIEGEILARFGSNLKAGSTAGLAPRRRIGQNAFMRPFKIGIDSYALKPLGLDPFEILDWAIINGADGVQFSEVPREASDKSFFRELADYAAQNALSLEWGGGEHVPFDLSTGRPKDIRPGNERAVMQAAALGVRTIRSCSGGLMRWRKDLPDTETLLRAAARELRAERPMFEDHGMTLAVETHFEFTTFELLRLFDMAGAEPGGGLGLCLDTMNLLTMLEDPVAATGRVLPWVVTTHVKDGGIILTEQGLTTFTAEAGRGVVDLPAVFRLLAKAREKDIRLSIEDHGGDFAIPIFDPEFRAGFPDLSVAELCALLKLAARTEALVADEDLAVLDRARWPAVCAARVKRDLEAVRRIVKAG
jgi:sugar phosphate isomerase/epimerase